MESEARSTVGGSKRLIERLGWRLQPRSSTPWMTHALPPLSARRFTCPRANALCAQRGRGFDRCWVARHTDGAVVLGLAKPGTGAHRWRDGRASDGACHLSGKGHLRQGCPRLADGSNSRAREPTSPNRITHATKGATPPSGFVVSGIAAFARPYWASLKTQAF